MSNIYGLVVCGGKSNRMGKDKSMLDYHGQPQRYYLYEMLKQLCEEVFISCSKEQVSDIPSDYKVIPDAAEYEDIGPMAALLSAFKKYPKANFLVVGCDYPFINNHHLKKLLNVKLETIPAVAYYDKIEEKFEPLLAAYHTDIKNILKKHFKQNDYSLQKVLEEVDAYRINARSTEIIRSINTTKEYKEVAELFKKFRP
jgi:molybdopterin-guanine dinucleotide biosynthesis protein A